MTQALYANFTESCSAHSANASAMNHREKRAALLSFRRVQVDALTLVPK